MDCFFGFYLLLVIENVIRILHYTCKWCTRTTPTTVYIFIFVALSITKSKLHWGFVSANVYFSCISDFSYPLRVPAENAVDVSRPEVRNTYGTYLVIKAQLFLDIYSLNGPSSITRFPISSPSGEATDPGNHYSVPTARRISFFCRYSTG